MEQKQKLPPDMVARLNDCAKRVGGKRALSVKSGISEAQIFRFLKGEQEPSYSSIMALAQAAECDAGWLITGKGEPWLFADNTVRTDLMWLAKATQNLNDVMLEYQTRFTPEQLGFTTALLALHYTNEKIHGRDVPEPTRAFILDVLAFLKPIRDREQLRVFYEGALQLIAPNSIKKIIEAASFCNLIVVGNTEYFNSTMGDKYFDRVENLDIYIADNGPIRAVLEEIKKRGRSNTPLNIADFGCGNGRYTRLLHSHFPHNHYIGYDISQNAILRANQLENKHTIAFQEADIRSVPADSNFFDIILCLYAIPFIPFLRGSKHGLYQVLKEIKRVLKVGGSCVVWTRHGDGLQLLPYDQLLNEKDFLEIASATGLKVDRCEFVNYKPPENIFPGGEAEKKYYQALLVKLYNLN